jgi:hypothetical protein
MFALFEGPPSGDLDLSAEAEALRAALAAHQVATLPPSKRGGRAHQGARDGSEGSEEEGGAAEAAPHRTPCAAAPATSVGHGAQASAPPPRRAAPREEAAGATQEAEERGGTAPPPPYETRAHATLGSPGRARHARGNPGKATLPPTRPAHGNGGEGSVGAPARAHAPRKKGHVAEARTSFGSDRTGARGAPLHALDGEDGDLSEVVAHALLSAPRTAAHEIWQAGDFGERPAGAAREHRLPRHPADAADDGADDLEISARLREDRAARTGGRARTPPSYSSSVFAGSGGGISIATVWAQAPTPSSTASDSLANGVRRVLPAAPRGVDTIAQLVDAAAPRRVPQVLGTATASSPVSDCGAASV